MSTICLGHVQSGAQCKAKTNNANGFCFQHQGQVPPAPAPVPATVTPIPAPTPTPAPAQPEKKPSNLLWLLLGLIPLCCLALLALAGLSWFLSAPRAFPAPTQESAPQADPTESPVPTVPTTMAPTEVPPTPTPIPPTLTPIVVYVQSTSAVPYNLPPQPQIGHPSLYLETGIPDPYSQSIDAHTKHWVIELLPGTTAIIGGFKVDGVLNGVYKAQAGPGTLDVTVTDGFVAITKNEWANAEFCFRVSQAVQFNWAHQTVLPLPGWTCQ